MSTAENTTGLAEVLAAHVLHVLSSTDPLGGEWLGTRADHIAARIGEGGNQ